MPALDVPPEVNMISLPAKIKVDESLKLMGLLGNKWDENMQYAIRHIMDTSTKLWETSVEVFAGALGIFSNIRFAFHEVINDVDLWKVNLYNAIKDDKDSVLIGMRVKSPDKETFEESKKDKETVTALDSSKINVDAAIEHLFTNIMSYYGKCDDFNPENKTSYPQRLDAIYPLSERLKDAKVCGLHAFDIIKKYKNKKGVIFIIDPPYLNTSGYENEIMIDKKYGKDKKKFRYPEHRELAKMLCETHQKYGNDFIYFCRITATREKDKTEKVIKNAAELPEQDRHLHGKIDDLYRGHGFYYIDVPYRYDGTIERIITSFRFDGAAEYGDNSTSGAGQGVES